MRILNKIFGPGVPFHYYQGYHDVCTIFLLVLDERSGYLAASHAAKYFFRDYLVQDFTCSVIPQMEMIQRIISEYARDEQKQKLVQSPKAI